MEVLVYPTPEATIVEGTQLKTPITDRSGHPMLFDVLSGTKLSVYPLQTHAAFSIYLINITSSRLIRLWQAYRTDRFQIEVRPTSPIQYVIEMNTVLLHF